ncbi:MAG: rhomboid family intramembrane serine protease [Planctomycetales bacterium]
MVEVYLSHSHLEALRLKNFLERHDVGADVRELASRHDVSDSEGLPTVFAVCVAAEDAETAHALVDEYRSILRQSTDQDGQSGELPGRSAVLESEVAQGEGAVKARIPWLTIVYVAACVVMSVGGWRESRRVPTAEPVYWGWRDALEVNSGSIWAIFTSVFPHLTLEHLVMNLLSGLPLAIVIERRCGRACWLGLVASTALIGAAIELARSGQLGLGSSGVDNAFFGFAMAVSVRTRLLPIWLFVPIVLWQGFGTVHDVSYAINDFSTESSLAFQGTYVHLGSLLWGILFALAFVYRWKPLATRTAAAAVLLAALVPLRGSPWHTGWLLSRANKALRSEDVASAIDWYSRAIAKNPELAGAYIGRANAYLLDSQLSDAIADLDQAVALDPQVPAAQGIRAHVLVLQSNLPAALESANREVWNSSDQSLGHNYATRGSIRLLANLFDDAIADSTKAIEVEPHVAERWSSRALARVELSEYSAALSDADRALTLDPNCIDARVIRGFILSDVAESERALTELNQAYELVQQELRRMPRDVWLLWKVASIQTSLFEIDGGDDRLSIAAQHADRAATMAPDSFEAWAALGEVELMRREFVSAERNLTRSLELYPDNYWGASLRGLARLELGRFDEALDDSDRALTINPQFALGYRNRALVRLARGEAREAMDDASRAIDLNDRYAEAYFLRGTARISCGESETGQADLARALKLDPKIESRDVARRLSPALAQ